MLPLPEGRGGIYYAWWRYSQTHNQSEITIFSLEGSYKEKQQSYHCHVSKSALGTSATGITLPSSAIYAGGPF